jgi:uncharacterized protein YpmB
MNRKKAILIITIPLVVGMVIIGTTLFSLIQANAQDAANSQNNQAAVTTKDTAQLSNSLNEDEDTKNLHGFSPNSFFEVQH